MSNYKTLHKFGVDEYIVEKSTFIGYAKPIKTEEEAIEFINEIKKKHKDATHNVWAYTIGENMNIQRYSDDGEPQGTAGIPTLEVIKKEDLRDVVVVVTRYFGDTFGGRAGEQLPLQKRETENFSKVVGNTFVRDILDQGGEYNVQKRIFQPI